MWVITDALVSKWQWLCSTQRTELYSCWLARVSLPLCLHISVHWLLGKGLPHDQLSWFRKSESEVVLNVVSWHQQGQEGQFSRGYLDSPWPSS